jgi:hypothetical protein
LQELVKRSASIALADDKDFFDGIDRLNSLQNPWSTYSIRQDEFSFHFTDSGPYIIWLQ